MYHTEIVKVKEHVCNTSPLLTSFFIHISFFTPHKDQFLNNQLRGTQPYNNFRKNIHYAAENVYTCELYSKF